MAETTIAASLQRELDRAWRMLRDAITYCPDEEWRAGTHPFLIPARLAFHIVQAVDFHLEDNPSAYDWGRFGFDWEEAEAIELPSKTAVLGYLEDVRAKAGAWVQRRGDVGLTGPDVPHAFFASALEHASYVLRHTMYHLGHLDAELHRRGCCSPQWG